MTAVQVIVSLFLLCFTLALVFWLVLLQIRRNRRYDRSLKKALSDPTVRSLVFQLVRNQYVENPATSEEKRSNNRRALAMIRLRKAVDDPKTRQAIYRLTDKSKW